MIFESLLTGNVLFGEGVAFFFEGRFSMTTKTTADQCETPAIAVGYGVKTLVSNADAGKIVMTTDAEISQPCNPEITEKRQTKVQDGYFMIWDSKSKN